MRAFGPGPATAVGSGAAQVAAAAGGRVTAMLDRLQPHARFLAGIASDLPPLAPARPVYLRAADAKPQSGQSLLRASP